MSTYDSFEVEVELEESENKEYGEEKEKGLNKLNLDYSQDPWKKRVSGWWKKYKDKIILAGGIFLIAAISFEAGFLRGQKNQTEPIRISQAACAPCPKAESADGAAASVQAENKSAGNLSSAENQKCAFVASKNSNKHHLPTCQFAQKIKAENKVCFSSKEEAESRGYQGAKCCIK